MSEPQLGSERFKRYSNWTTLCSVIARLIHVVTSFTRKTSEWSGWESFSETPSTQELAQAKVVIIQVVQQDAYKGTLKNLKEWKQTNAKSDTLRKLNPVMDQYSLLRVGGRLSSSFTDKDMHPLIIPSTSHIATLVVKHFHEHVAHQGRHTTEVAIRGAVIHKCVKCSKLRDACPENLATLYHCRARCAWAMDNYNTSYKRWLCPE